VGAAISACVHARGPRRRAVEGGGGGTGERGPQDSGTDARAHNGPKHRQGDPTEQREGEREEGCELAPTGGAHRDRRRASEAGLSGPTRLLSLFLFL
jgi:hypothetical protein